MQTGLNWVVCYVFIIIIIIITVDVVVEWQFPVLVSSSAASWHRLLKQIFASMLNFLLYEIVPSSGKKTPTLPHLCHLPVLWQFCVGRLFHAKLVCTQRQMGPPLPNARNVNAVHKRTNFHQAFVNVDLQSAHCWPLFQQTFCNDYNLNMFSFFPPPPHPPDPLSSLLFPPLTP